MRGICTLPGDKIVFADALGFLCFSAPYKASQRKICLHLCQYHGASLLLQCLSPYPEVSTMRGICTLPGDKIVFADAFCLRVVSPEGELLQTIASFGNGPGQFNLPLSVAANRLGFIFVSDSTNHRVEKFASDGRFMLMFGKNGPKCWLPRRDRTSWRGEGVCC